MPRMLARAGILVALFAPSFALAAYNDVTLTTDTVLTVNGVTLNVSGSSAAVESITVNSGNMSVVLPSGSSFQVSAPGLEQINASTAVGQTNFICNNSQSLIKYAPSTSVTVTITPIATLCSSTNSGGGSSTGGSIVSSASTVPSTPAVTTTTTPPAQTTPVTSPTITASGLSSSQIQSILNVLVSFNADADVIAKVKASLEGTAVTGSVTSTAVGVFKSDLTVGSLGSEVKALQEFLNSRGYKIATSGPGSPGSETTRFGALTRAALVKYQKANGITPAVGYFGPKTRAAVQADQ